MYKVFLKKHVIFFGAKKQFYAQFKAADYQLIEPKKKELKSLVGVITRKRKRRVILIETADPHKVFLKFKSLFKIIIAAGGVVKNKSGEILFIFRNGKWDLPKGKLDPGESIKVCAVREVEEECGISGVKLGKPLITTYHSYKDKNNVLKPTFWYNMKYKGDEELVPQLDEGITDVAWIHPKNFKLIKGNTYNSIVDVLQKIEK